MPGHGRWGSTVLTEPGAFHIPQGDTFTSHVQLFLQLKSWRQCRVTLPYEAAVVSKTTGYLETPLPGPRVLTSTAVRIPTHFTVRQQCVVNVGAETALPVLLGRGRGGGLGRSCGFLGPGRLRLWGAAAVIGGDWLPSFSFRFKTVFKISGISCRYFSRA